MYHFVRLRYRDKEGIRHTILFTGVVRYEIGDLIEEQTHKFDLMLEREEIRSYTINIRPNGYED